MKTFSSVLALIVLFLIPSSICAQDFVSGELIIDIKHEYLPISPILNGQGTLEMGLPSVDSLNALYAVHDFETLVDTAWEPNKGLFVLKFPDSLGVAQILSSYLADAHVRVASPNYIPQPEVTPRDYYFPEQWGLSKIKCPEAWRYTNGSPAVIIQILDGGTDYGHPDLVHNIWQNLGEDADGDGHTVEWDASQNRWILDPGDVGDMWGDNDDNLYCGDLVGFDFRDAPCGMGYGYDPQPTRPEFPGDDWYDHGDKTAGTAAAVTDNSLTWEEAQRMCELQTGTVAGTSWFSRIMIARMFDDTDAMNAIDYARNNGAEIISMSWSQSGDNPSLHQKIDEAWESGLLLIASAGSLPYDAPRYPAFYGNVIAVAGTDENDVKAPNSNWGPWVDICAPWNNHAPNRDPWNWSSHYCYDYDFAGTSASAPFVAGVAAMVWSCNLNATNAQVRAAIESTTDGIYHIEGNQDYIDMLGSGRVNARRAVQVFRPNPPPPGDANTDGIVDVSDIPFLVNYLYHGGPPPDPVCVGDVNDDGVINVGDVVYLVTYLYRGGPAPQDGCD